MSSDYKLDSDTCHDDQDPEYNSPNGKFVSKKGNIVYKISDGFLKHGNRSFINVATNVVRQQNKYSLTSDNYEYLHWIVYLVTLHIQIVSALSGGITDLSFDAVGYTWQIMNCIFTASYSLTLRWDMDTAKQSTPSVSLNEVSMVLLNNALSLPFAAFLIIIFGEWEYVYKVDVVMDPFFWVVATASGLLGLSISFTSM